MLKSCLVEVSGSVHDATAVAAGEVVSTSL